MENDLAAEKEVTVEDSSNNINNNLPVNDDEDDEFGDFADFESAPQASDTSWNEQTINVNAEKSEESRSSSQNEIISPKVILPSLVELLSDNSIFCTDEEFNHIYGSDVGVKLYDLLGECDKEDIEMSENSNLYTNIWKDLRIVEETRALEFSLVKSQSYFSFLGALQMSAKKVVPNTLDFLTPLRTSIEVVDHDNEVVQGELTPDGEKNISQNDIPPVSFDWEKSGLENPMNCNYKTPQSNLLDYDFFFNSKNGSCSVENPTYSLQNDLYAFGLISSVNENKDSIKKMTNIDKLIQNVSQKETGNDIVDEETISYDSLTPEGKILYNSLPDYSFMLSDVLVFPSKGKE